MKANELRIGNYVQYPNLKKPVRVSIIDTTETSTETKCQPIPLTEKWLFWFGFTKHHSDFYNDVLYLINLTDNLEFDWGVYPKQFGSGIQIKNSDKLKYVHQLQNIYFAITNEELTLKQQ
jgi:hypothetical protein